MPDKAISGMTDVGALSASNLTLVTSDGASKKATAQQIWDALNVLTASGALSLTDALAVYTGGATKQTTVQLLFDTVALLESATSLSATDKFALIRNSVAKSVTLTNLLDYYQRGLPNSLTWLRKWVLPQGGGTVSDSIGDSVTGSQSGTGSASSYTAPTATSPTGLIRTTGSTIGDYAFFNSTATAATSIYCNSQLHYTILVKPNTITNCRLACYVINNANWSNYDEADSPNPAVYDYIGFRYSTAASDPAWMIANGGSGGSSFTTTGVAPTTAKPVCFDIKMRADGKWDLLINGILVGDGITGRKLTTTGCAFTWGLTTLSAANQSLEYYYHTVDQRYPL